MVVLNFLVVISVCLGVVGLLVAVRSVCGCCDFGLVLDVLCWAWMLMACLAYGLVGLYYLVAVVCIRLWLIVLCRFALFRCWVGDLGGVRCGFWFDCCFVAGLFGCYVV